MTYIYACVVIFVHTDRWIVIREVSRYAELGQTSQLRPSISTLGNLIYRHKSITIVQSVQTE